MSQFENFDKYFPLPTSTTERPWYVNPPRPEPEEIEYDDTAPLPLLIGIGLALFIGFVILILICCCCRVRRPAPDASQANYQRAPLADGGGGGGVAYPLTTLPTESGFGSPPVSYQPSPAQMTSLVKMDYGMIGSGPGITQGTDSIHQVPQTQLKQQPPHFGGVPTFQQAQYVATSYAPGFYPGQTQGVSYHHSSQASSSASEATSDNAHSHGGVRTLGQPRFPYQVQQTALPPGQGYQYQMVPQQPFHSMMSQPRLNHHQLIQQQQQKMYMSGRTTPAAVVLHPDSQFGGVGVNYTGNINTNQNQQMMNPALQQHPLPVSSAPQPSLDNSDSILDAPKHPMTSTPVSTPVTVMTGAIDAAAASQQISSEDTSPSAKPLLPVDGAHPPSVSSNTDEEEEEE